MKVSTPKINSWIEKGTFAFLCLALFFNVVQGSGQTNFSIQITPGPQCYDGQDNDNDGKEDFPDDPDCESQSDNSEANASSGTSPAPSPVPVVTPRTSIIFTGKAYPASTITLLKDAQVTSFAKVNADATFQMTITDLVPGVYFFSLYGEDRDGRRSALLSFPVNAALGSTTQVSGIFIAPTIELDKDTVRQGESIAIFGQSFPQSEVIIEVNSEVVKTKANAVGAYLYNYNTNGLVKGVSVVKPRAVFGVETSSVGKTLSFKVGELTVIKNPAVAEQGDFNSDGKVNLVDFSILAYWYKRPLSDSFRELEANKLNNDGKIDLVDFSIMAFHWTG
jgi:hypothetical protein